MEAWVGESLNGIEWEKFEISNFLEIPSLVRSKPINRVHSENSSSDLNFIHKTVEMNRVTYLTGLPRSGKTRLALSFPRSHYYNAEDPKTLKHLTKCVEDFHDKAGLIIVDNVHLVKNFLQSLVLLFEAGCTLRFLLIGKTGVQAFINNKTLNEVGIAQCVQGQLTLLEVEAFQNYLYRLWFRGGLPESFLANSDIKSTSFRDAYIREQLIPLFSSVKIGGKDFLQWAVDSHCKRILITDEMASIFEKLGYLGFFTILQATDSLTLFLIQDTGIFHHLAGIFGAKALEESERRQDSWCSFVYHQVMKSIRFLDPEIRVETLGKQKLLIFRVFCGHEKIDFLPLIDPARARTSTLEGWAEKNTGTILRIISLEEKDVIWKPDVVSMGLLSFLSLFQSPVISNLKLESDYI